MDELSGHVQAHFAPPKPKRNSSSSATSPYLSKAKTSSKKSVPSSIVEEYEIQSEIIFQEVSERELRKDLADLWEERMATGDFKLILGGAEGKVERVHSSILAVRS